MKRRIGRIIRIEQVECCSPDLCLPRPHTNAVTRESELNTDPLTVLIAYRNDWQQPGVVVGVERALRSVGIQHLAKISLLIEQSDTHDGNTEIARRLQLISRHVTQTTRIDR